MMKKLKDLLKEAVNNNLVKLRVDTYEDEEYPVVRHEFIGKDKEEAEGYFKAHLKTDKFLAGCEEGNFGDIECRNEKKWIGLEDENRKEEDEQE